MENSDKNRFAEIMTGLAEDCSANISKMGLRIRFEALREYSIDQIEQAVIRVMKLNIYTKMPTTGTIINAIEGTPEDRSESQLMEIRKEIARIGSYGTPKFSDPITEDLVSYRFGWDSICAMTNKEFEFFSRDFKAAYISQKKEIAPMIGAPSPSVLKLVRNVGNGGLS